MALPPKDSIKPDIGGRMANYAIELVKFYNVWALAFLFLIELISFFLWNNKYYKDYYYPILNQLSYILILINIYTWHKKLRFCLFKQFSIILMIIYYSIGISAIVFKIESFINYIQYFFISFSILLFIFSLKKRK